MRASDARCPDDLLARSRRGPLSPVERRALDAHLGVCGLCRAAVALGALHDEIPDQPSGDDEAVVARLAGRVVARSGRGPRRARPTAVAAGLALMAMAGGAAAWMAARRAPAPPAQVVDPAPARSPRSAPRVAPEITPIPPAVPVAEPIASARPVAESHRRRGPTVDRVAPDLDAPDRLFAQANAARGAGDLRAAASGYERLERQYPRSPEATVSLVSAGDLLARLGDPAGALQRFDRYLAENARGPLAPEALFGRARCLRELGRPRDEAGAWRALLRDFPGSLYDRTARNRLDELEPGR
jgi:TolA-binding protein